ncbi:phytanoyl-CoA dioxygenase family protein [Denitrobaculum tricleocarpae]|uniref:Phytanoyl-CoA dioxygenase family protein n=1 Tax=Denitrobaculum tricleocarpae TaxID=2591009 RepID=A0A545TMP8_9PROT|nr:phytanoyl-CoA dioxygenase family protein [Denitrobaculum tricleocarpae]TQV78466.1 phytanoyl-CoA dioxygenase family protein [Denitrobaculum tricleocarpae]
MPHLSPEDIARYRKDGYLVPRFRLSQERIAGLRATLDELIEANPDVRPEKLVSAHIEGKNAEGVRGSAAFLELAREPEILDMVSDLIGEDIILWGCQIFCKPGRTGFETPWHQDGHYWPIRPLATCTVWVALDPSTRANGCLRVIPGSHGTGALFPHLHETREDIVLSDRTAEDAFDAGTAVDLELEPGEMSLHDVFMIHGADANVSAQRRAGVAIRYMPATSVFERDLRPLDGKSGIPVNFATRPLWLLRGEDRTGRNDFAIGHSSK